MTNDVKRMPGVPIFLSLLLLDSLASVSTFVPQNSATFASHSRGESGPRELSWNFIRERRTFASEARQLWAHAAPRVAVRCRRSGCGGVEIKKPNHMHHKVHQKGDIRQHEGESTKSFLKRLFRAANHDLRQGRTQRGIDRLRACLEVDPLDSYSWLALARAEARRGHQVSL